MHQNLIWQFFADEDGLAIYRRIAEDSKDYLNDGGKRFISKLATNKVKVCPLSLRKIFQTSSNAQRPIWPDRMVVITMEKIKQELEKVELLFANGDSL